ncbi:MAG: cyclic nucleotide-binding domain-containing protein [Sphaerochaetaceae bacterium]|nr:cyclic nucleotide-binding domain-containing protein [Sphaerochaetaceae bacterium]MDC7247010.1 cyclic nucleotide-binding domain-containing protein [Sphaerochaetaceae bacterium]
MSECLIANSFFNRYSLFGGLTDRQLDTVRPYIKERTVTEGTYILRQGEFNATVYFIVKGSVSIVKHAPENMLKIRNIVTLKEGDSFGEMELIDVQPCAASAIARKETSLVSLDNKDFYQLSKIDLPLYTMMMLNLARDISRRLRCTDNLLAMAQIKSDSNVVV